MISKESKYVSAEENDEWLKNLPNIIDGSKQKDIHNVEESNFYHLMPARALAFKCDNF